MKATNAEFARSKREVFKSSYSNHYRSGLMKLLGVLGFHSSNDQHKPVIEALKLIERHKDSSTTYLPLGETIPLEGVVRKDWMEFAIFTPTRGPSASCAPCTRRASSRPCATDCAARRSGWWRRQVAQPR